MNTPNQEVIPPAVRVPPVLPPALDAPLSPPILRAGPWGLWATLGLTCAIGGAYLAAQAFAVGLYTGVQAALAHGKLPSTAQIASDGLVLALATLLSAPVGVGLSLGFAWLRRTGSVRTYLALAWPRPGIAVRWLALLGLLVVGSDSLTCWLGRPLVPDVMVDCYRHMRFPPLLWLAIVVAAPLAEEFVFRGFLFTGLRHSRLGSTWAIALTAAVWAGMHLQYDFYGIATVFFTGLLLGWARLRTGSLWLCVLMHALMNLIATLEIVFLVP
jgi:uncharacterized protein